MLNCINLISPTPPAPFILFNAFLELILREEHILVYQYETVRKLQQGRGRIILLILCSM